MRFMLALFASISMVSAAVAQSLSEHSDTGGPFVGHTLLLRDGYGGIGVEYMSGDGGAHFWYQGESRILHGRWRVENDRRVCFSYPGYSFDYAPHIAPGEWFCIDLITYYDRIVSKRADDLFDLQTAAPPFVLRRGEYYSGFRDLQDAVTSRRR